MAGYRDLKVYELALSFSVLVYERTKAFPVDEKFGLISQIRRASVSVVANIAEGSRKKSRADFARMLNIAEGSLSEVTALFELSARLNYLTNEDLSLIDRHSDEIARMLYALRHKVETD